MKYRPKSKSEKFELQIKVETFYATNFSFDLLSDSISFGVLHPIVEWILLA